ncbi:MAG: DUF2804 domain-containing protein [Treponema sp.]|nr:DUF2804 domain-containing protein [Treponema sp.]
MPQNEIFSRISIFDEKGFPQNFGWARQAYYYYDPALTYAPKYKISESDRYILFSPTHMAVFEIRDDGWLGYMCATVISLRDKKRTTQAIRTILPLGAYEMPANSTSGSVRWKNKKNHLDFIYMESGARIIKVDIPRFGKHRSLRGALVLSELDESQSLITNQPWRNEKNAFRLSRCSPWFFTEGVIQFGGTEIVFTRGNAWGIFDWNRCVRPNSDIRYWAASCGMIEGHLFGFCVGYSSADFSLGTENGFFVNGKLHKLDQVTFHIPLSNWLDPWRFTSNDNRLEMQFNPHQERSDRRSLFFHNTSRRQIFGFFTGKVHLDDGSLVEFHNLTGFAERCKTQF